MISLLRNWSNSLEVSISRNSNRVIDVLCSGDNPKCYSVEWKIGHRKKILNIDLRQSLLMTWVDRVTSVQVLRRMGKAKEIFEDHYNLEQDMSWAANFKTCYKYYREWRVDEGARLPVWIIWRNGFNGDLISSNGHYLLWLLPTFLDEEGTWRRTYMRNITLTRQMLQKLHDANGIWPSIIFNF